MKRIFTWFWHFEKGLWGCEVESNRYVSSLLLMFAFLCGAAVGVSCSFGSPVSFLADINVVSVTALMVYVAGIAVCESICVAQNLSVAILRSILLLFLLFVLYAGPVIMFRVILLNI